ncbi:glycosyltransferase family 2 protein [Anaerosacchariphilus polymeriproducens]|uniref:Glycosyltransferase family 2 protein n=1 Tax=Anaerosacchariphilus polymeriproducens TaxID=1812858 RepID=A0A371ARA7_9FIRM|nr:glycosyltransferase family 2 protein [Anaerosacchariphilus polymeriproducens]RDU22116.1 glycosyltransferase family 2 protein [Anaerosacchariphilus polymeriproducens]
MNKSVAVLMSTYNGEKYIREQIDSVLVQKNVDISLIVRDDSSKDGTTSILKEYEKAGKLRLLTGINMGVGNSFMELLYQSPDADYYAFCDQDDIWLQNKMEVAITKLEKLETKAPGLYISNQTLVNEDGKKIKTRYQTEPKHKLENVIFANYIAGCTMVMNQNLRNILIQQKHRPSQEFLELRIHDVWVMLVANLSGKIIYDKNSYILYRQHQNNVVGAKSMALHEKLHDKYKRMVTKKYKKARSKTAIELQRCFEGEISQKDKEILTLFQHANSIRGVYNIMNHPKLKKAILGNKVIFVMKSLTGWI